MNRKEAINLLAELSEKIKPKDFLVIVHGLDEVSMHTFDNASVIKQGEYYFIFPEHHTPQLFHEDEYCVRQYKQIPIG